MLPTELGIDIENVRSIMVISAVSIISVPYHFLSLCEIHFFFEGVWYFYLENISALNLTTRDFIFIEMVEVLFI